MSLNTLFYLSYAFPLARSERPTSWCCFCCTCESVSWVGVCPRCSVHRWRPLTAGTEREMEFSSAHCDNLVRRVLSPSEMEEYFEGRSDFLCYRHVFFNQQVQPPEPNQPQTDLENLHVQVSRFKGLRVLSLAHGPIMDRWSIQWDSQPFSQLCDSSGCICTGDNYAEVAYSNGQVVGGRWAKMML